jgi:hypothetical protein
MIYILIVKVIIEIKLFDNKCVMCIGRFEEEFYTRVGDDCTGISFMKIVPCTSDIYCFLWSDYKRDLDW